MKKEVLVTVKGTSDASGEPETTSLITEGTYYQQNGDYYIVYDEDPATALGAGRTVIKAEPEGVLSITRMGGGMSKLIVERGQRHLCHYSTQAGDILLGISTKRLDMELSQCGGRVSCEYSLDVNSAHMSNNQIEIEVKEC